MRESLWKRFSGLLSPHGHWVETRHPSRHQAPCSHPLPQLAAITLQPSCNFNPSYSLFLKFVDSQFFPLQKEYASSETRDLTPVLTKSKCQYKSWNYYLHLQTIQVSALLLQQPWMTFSVKSREIGYRSKKQFVEFDQSWYKHHCCWNRINQLGFLMMEVIQPWTLLANSVLCQRAWSLAESILVYSSTFCKWKWVYWVLQLLVRRWNQSRPW